jgi:hypothetical protein
MDPLYGPADASRKRDRQALTSERCADCNRTTDAARSTGCHDDLIRQHFARLAIPECDVRDQDPPISFAAAASGRMALQIPPLASVMENARKGQAMAAG